MRVEDLIVEGAGWEQTWTGFFAGAGLEKSSAQSSPGCEVHGMDTGGFFAPEGDVECFSEYMELWVHRMKIEGLRLWLSGALRIPGEDYITVTSCDGGTITLFLQLSLLQP